MVMLSTSNSASWTSTVYQQDAGQTDWNIYQIIDRMSYGKDGYAIHPSSTSTTAVVVSPTEIVAGQTLTFAAANGATASIKLSATPGKTAPAYLQSWSSPTTKTGSITGNIQHITTSPDGTLLYAIEGDTPTIRQYTMSTPYDFSTANYTGKSFVVNNSNVSVQFSPNGVYMYTLPLKLSSGGPAGTVTQYVLSTPWDVTTATSIATASISPNHSSSDFSHSYQISGNGQYLLCLWAQEISTMDYNYIRYATLSSLWNISGVTYAGMSTSPTWVFSSEAMKTVAVRFSPDGTMAYLKNTAGLGLQIYSLPTATPWIGTPTIQQTISTGPMATIVTNFNVSYNGQHIYRYDAGTNVQYTSTANNYNWSHLYQIGISSLGFTSTPTKVFSIESSPKSSVQLFTSQGPAYFSSNISLTRASSNASQYVGTGTPGIYTDNQVRISETVSDARLTNTNVSSTQPSTTIPGGNNNSVENIIAAWTDPTTNKTLVCYSVYSSGNAGFIKLFDVAFTQSAVTATWTGVGSWWTRAGTPTTTIPKGAFISPTGTQVYILTASGLNLYNLPTAWDISAISDGSPIAQTTDVASLTAGRGLYVRASDNGRTIFSIDSDGVTVRKYNTTAAWSLSGVTSSQTFSMANESGDFKNVMFTSDGLTMYAYSNATDILYRYDLSTAWDLTTASFSNQSTVVNSQETFTLGSVSSTNTNFLFFNNTNNSSTDANIRRVYTVATPVAPFNVTPSSVVESPAGTYTITFSPALSVSTYNVEVLPSPTHAPVNPGFVTTTPQTISVVDSSWVDVYSTEVQQTGKTAYVKYTGGQHDIVKSTTMNLWVNP